MVVNDILRATLKGTIASADLVEMVFHYICITGTETDYTAIATAIGTQINTAFGGLEAQTSTRINMNGLDLFEWDFVANEMDGKAGIVTTALVGTAGGAALPDGSAGVMRFVTEELRRQGRKFVPGIIEANTTDNALAAAWVTPALATAALLNDDIITGGATVRPCTFNSTVGSPRFETASKFVQTVFVNALVGYQRRRQPGSGA